MVCLFEFGMGFSQVIKNHFLLFAIEEVLQSNNLPAFILHCNWNRTESTTCTFLHSMGFDSYSATPILHLKTNVLPFPIYKDEHYRYFLIR